MVPQSFNIDKISAHCQSIRNQTLAEFFAADPTRAKKFSLEYDAIFFDYSKEFIDPEGLKLLFDLAENLNLKTKIEQVFSGEKVNHTEGRAVLHSLLRDFSANPFFLDGQDLKGQILEVYKKLSSFAESFGAKKKHGSTGKILNHIVNIGIGGSDLGPKMAARALRQFANPDLKIDFVSNLDPAEIEEILKQVDPHTVLFVVASKTFTTEETITNAKIAKEWLRAKLGPKADISCHFIALSTNFKAAKEFSIAEQNIFPFWDWVGGRFSLGSSIGMSLMLYIGVDQFSQLLKGMHAIDLHFKNSPLEKNIPVILGLLGYWYNNFMQFQSLAIVPYSSDLALFPSYLQQLEMESNGKSVDRQGKNVDYQTAPIIWGAAGTDSQHSFFQLLHQGTKVVPTNFIGFLRSRRQNQASHSKLMSHFLAQQQALAFGAKDSSWLGSRASSAIEPFVQFTGNRPNCCILFDELSPYSLGQLIALYEHKVFVQGCLWNLNSFDQWGVELGKVLSKRIQLFFNAEAEFKGVVDPSTQQLIELFLGQRDVNP